VKLEAEIIDPTAETKFLIIIFWRRPRIMQKEAMIIHPSQEAKRKTDAIMETVLTFGILENMSVSGLSSLHWERLLTPIAVWNSFVSRIPDLDPGGLDITAEDTQSKK
jgi:hypothetical protein